MIEMTDWQPIETAPRDGAEILLIKVYKGRVFSPVVARFVSNWCAGGAWEICEDPECYFEHYLWKPTHWMPLPQPPEKDDGREKQDQTK